ncbi:MAG TPA: oxidoreductase [Casimicrobiaceae bacterium]|nr:oxidoreductase [Casimicrobiaceae bacterium]
MHNDVRVGLIGFGFASKTFHAPLIAATEGMRLVAVATSNAGKVHAALGPDVQASTVEALVARRDIDLVVIATPNDLHRPQALAALNAGHDVVVDKPFALDLAQAQEVTAAAQRQGRLLSVFHNRRWDSDVLTLARVLRSGRLGRVVEVFSHFDRFRPEVRQRWREGSGPGAGLWLDLAPHLLDQALQLFGSPSAIAVDIANQRDRAVADDWFHAQLRWSEGPYAGLRMHLHASALVARPMQRFIVHGTKGSFSVDGLDGQEDALRSLPDRARIDTSSWGQEERVAHLWTGDEQAVVHEPLRLESGAYPAYYAAVRDAIRGVGPNPVPPHEALATQALLDTGLRAARDHREITL